MPNTYYGNLIDVSLYEGQVYSTVSKTIRTRLNSGNAVIPFGRALVQGTNADEALLPSGGSGVFVGIAVLTQAYEVVKDSSGDVGYPADVAMDVLDQGDIVVYVEEAVAPGDAVYFRHTANGAGKAIVGRFRNDADTATCTQVTNARWISKTAGAGLAILNINLP